MSIDLIIRNASCVSHRGIEKLDIAVRDGIIVALGDLSNVTGKAQLDAIGLHILPGLIDTEFHLRSGFENETRAAVRGGITTVLAVADDNINIENGSYCDHGFFIHARRENLNELAEMDKAPDCAGIHFYMAEGNGFEAIEEDKEILRLLKSVKRRVTVHAEDQLSLDKRVHLRKEADVSSHPHWHNEKSFVEGLRRILAIARGAGRPVHVQHISSVAEMALLAAYKDIATASISPYHLSLSAPDCYDHFYNYVKLDPPIRDEENRVGLWKGLSNGIVDMLASGHLPQFIEQKEKDYPFCPSGAPGVQTMLPLMLDQVSKGSLSLLSLVDLTSASPARTFNIASKGRIAVGYDADFSIVDLKKRWIFEDDDVESGCGWDLYAGAEFTGQVKGTIVRGKIIMWDDEIVADPSGRPVCFTDNFAAYPKEH